eukprot:CAMPEP_0119033694 /NCGR_PEP_ID=MMETSP1177-20130426/750_1 /TAXON_ID=2985 /ORGANISM="Ochromonas sp, Strain CCMP1899" /LENGTH=213 /DNA_ID=CAMNT_0006990633 /DNA_START=295 /DNA_END=936 /DNA_ORIENTATION=-
MSPIKQRVNKRSSLILSAKRRTTLSKRSEGSEIQPIEPSIEVEKTIEVPVAAPFSMSSISAAANSDNSETDSTSTIERTPSSLKSSREDFYKTSAKPVPKGKELSQKISDDITDFERIASLQEKKAVVEENKVFATAKNVFGVLFIGDFFVVIFFLVWFLAAAAMQSTNPFLLERFQDIFQPVVVPSLTVLMVGSMASGAMEEQANKGKTKNY